MLFCAPAGSNSLAISAKANRTDKLPYPHKRPVAYGTNRLTPAAAAGIPLRSNVVGNLTVPPTNAPLPDRFHKTFPGNAKELPAARRAFFHRGIIPLLTLFFSAFGSQKTAVTPQKMRLWGYVVGRRFDVPHFSTGGVAPCVAEWFSAIALNHSCSPP